MAETRRGKRFYFSRGQLFMLGAGFAVTAVIIFLLGMMVGKGIEEGKMLKVAAPAARIPVKPSDPEHRPAPTPPPKEELTFYDTLTKTPAAQSPLEKKLQDTKRGDKVAQADVKGSILKRETRPTGKAEDRQAEATGKTSSPETAERKEAGTSWTVQVNAFPDEDSAKIWVDRLKNKGYKAYVTEVRNKGKVWYRVRIGHYDTREEAEKIEETLKNKENLTKAFATSR